MAKLIVGIDFGTSTTVVRYKKEGTNDILPVRDKNGQNTYIPSAIFRIQGQQQSLYGHEALNAKDSGMEGELITNFKMGLLDREDVKEQKKQYIQEFLRFVYQCFENETQGMAYDSLDVYVSYPAKWSSDFVDFMKDAVKKAGFIGNIYGINEPKAATYNMLHRHLSHLQKSKMLTQGKPMHVFMLDMGAGTTDIVIFRLQLDANGKVIIDNLRPYPTIDNPYLCGGREIDQLLQNYMFQYIKDKTGVSDFDEDFFTLSEAKKWKDQSVSPTLQNASTVNIPNTLKPALKFMPNGKTMEQSFVFTRSTFETVTYEHWDNLYKLICSAIQLYKEKFGIGAEDIDLLYLTGGHSRWYTVPRLFNGEGINDCIGKDYKDAQGNMVKALDFTKLREETWRLFEDALPHECVAIGMCLQEDIEIEDVGANNVWVQLEINGVKNTPILIVKAGDNLPVVKKCNIDLGRIQSDWDGKQGNDFRGWVHVYSGTTIKSAHHRQNKIELNLALWKFFLFGNMYFVKCSCNVEVNKDGSLKYYGHVNILKDNSWATSDNIYFRS